MAVITQPIEASKLNEFMTAKAREAKEYIEGKNGLQTEKAQQALQELFAQAMEVLEAEMNGTSSFKNTTIYPVLKDLDDMVSFEGIQHETELQRTLSKVYRLCIELTFHQCWRQKEKPVWTETRDNIIEHAKRMVKATPSEIEKKFEYSCAQQGAKCLTPADNIWLPFAEAAGNMIIGTATQNPGTVMEGLRVLIKNYIKELVEDWYLKTYEWRWAFTQIYTYDAFLKETKKETFQEYLKKGKNSGYEYAQGIVMLFVDAIRSQKTEPKLRDLLVHGNDDLPGVISIINWKYEPSFAELYHAANPLAILLAKSKTPFQDVRKFVAQFLRELALKPEFQRYRKESIDALNKRLTELQDLKGKRYKNEKQQIQKTITDLHNEIQKLGEKEEGLLAKLTNLQMQLINKIRAEGDVQADSEKVEAELTDVGNLKDSKENELKNVEEGKRAIEIIETEDQEEFEFLQQITPDLDNK